MQSHEWRPTPQCLHTWLSTYAGPRASQVQGQLWDSAVLEQWLAAIATPSLQVARVGLAGLHHIGTEFIRQVLSESKKVWLVHGRVRDGLIKACSGPRGTMAWALRELQPPAVGAAQRPQGGPELRPLYMGTVAPPPGHRCTTHITQHAFRHTGLLFCITRMQNIPAIATW